MVRLEEVEDETFGEKVGTEGEVLLADDDADYTDTGKHKLTQPTKRVVTKNNCFDELMLIHDPII